MSSDTLRYVIRLDAETQGLRQANAAFSEFLSSVKAGVGIDIGGRLVQSMNEITAAMKSSARAGIEYQAQIEDLAASYRTLLGSSELARMRIADLEKFGDKNAFELPGLGKAYKMLEMLTDGALSGKDGLTLIGDAAKFAEVTFEDLASTVARFYSNAMAGKQVSRQTMELERLGLISGQVAHRIERLQAAGAKGPEIWAEAEKALSRFAGEMDRRAQTFNGRLASLGEAWQQAMGEMMAGATGAASGGMKDLTEALGKPETVQMLREMGVKIRQLVEDLSKLAQWAVEHGPKIADTIMMIGKAFALWKITNIVSGGLTAMAGMARGQLAAGAAAAAGGTAMAGGARAAQTAGAVAGATGAAAAAGGATARKAALAAKLQADRAANMQSLVPVLPYLATGRAAAVTAGRQKAMEEALALEGKETSSRILPGKSARRIQVNAADLGPQVAATKAASAASAAGTAAKVGATASRVGGVAGAAGRMAMGALGGPVGLTITAASLAYDMVKDYADSVEAETESIKAATKADADHMTGLRKLASQVDSVAKKKALLKQMEEECTAAHLVGNNGLAVRIAKLGREVASMDETALAAKEKAAAEKQAQEEAALNARVNAKTLDKMNTEIAADKSAFQEKFQGADRPEQIELARRHIEDLRKEQAANDPKKFMGDDPEEFKEKAARYKALYSEITSWEQRLANLKKSELRETTQARKATLRDLRGQSYNELLSGSSADSRVGLLSSRARQVIEGNAAANGKGPDAATLEKIRAGIDKLVELNKQKDTDDSGMWAD